MNVHSESRDYLSKFRIGSHGLLLIFHHLITLCLIAYSGIHELTETLDSDLAVLESC